jgi:hypothetical protein
MLYKTIISIFCANGRGRAIEWFQPDPLPGLPPEWRAHRWSVREDVTRAMTSSVSSLSEVISTPSGKGNSGVVGILCIAFSQERSKSIHVFSMVHQKPERAGFSPALTTAVSKCLGLTCLSP